MSSPSNEDSPLKLDMGPRRVIWQLMLGGVFDRYPDLKLALTECRADWLPDTLSMLDARFDEGDTPLLMRPSEYWERHCFVTASSIHRAEVEMRDDIGLDQLMFGVDYPHPEGTWPNTWDWLRFAFAGVPEDDARRILASSARTRFVVTASIVIASPVSPRASARDPRTSSVTSTSWILVCSRSSTSGPVCAVRPRPSTPRRSMPCSRPTSRISSPRPESPAFEGEGSMSEAQLFHVGILVADITTAVHRFEDVLGLDFGPVRGFDIEWEGTQPFKGEVFAVYSKQGPPYIELLQGAGDGLFSIAGGERIHHLGMWEPGGWDAYGARDPRHCLEVMSSLRFESDGPPRQWMTDPDELCGARIEYSDLALRPGIEAWIAGTDGA
jgi:hypothetical protein